MKSNDSMGMSKHRKSGFAGYSPKARHRMKLEAEKKSVKSKPFNGVSSVSELFNREGKDE